MREKEEAKGNMKVPNIVDDNTVFGTIDKDGGRIMSVILQDDKWYVFLNPQIDMSTVTNLLISPRLQPFFIFIRPQILRIVAAVDDRNDAVTFFAYCRCAQKLILTDNCHTIY